MKRVSLLGVVPGFFGVVAVGSMGGIFICTVPVCVDSLGGIAFCGNSGAPVVLFNFWWRLGWRRGPCSTPPLRGGGVAPASGTPGGGGLAFGTSPPPLCFGGMVVGGVALDEAASVGKVLVLSIFIRSFSAPTALTGTFALSVHGLRDRIKSSVGLRSNSLSYGGV